MIAAAPGSPTATDEQAPRRSHIKVSTAPPATSRRAGLARPVSFLTLLGVVKS